MQKCSERILAILIIFTGFTIHAQVNTVSPYSRLGLGEFQRQGYTRGVSMGGAGLALGDPYYINNTNPASYSNIKLTTFELGFMTNYITQEQREPAVKVENSNAGMRYFSFAIPVLDRWGSAVGLQPYTARGYDIFGTRIGPDSITVQDRYTGSGGISKVYWGNSFAVLDNFSVGINASYLFGQVEDRDELTWGQGINNSVIEELVTVRGFKFNYGLQYSQAFANNNELSLGLTFSNSTGLNADLENYAYTTRGSGLSVDSISDLSSQKITLPTEFGVGLTYGQRLLPRDRNEWWALSKYRWSFSADLELYQGSEFTNYNGNTPLANGYKLSAGGFITPSLVPEEIKRNGSYFGKIEYRLGGFYEMTPNVVLEEQLTEYGITFGFGLPVHHKSSIGEEKRSIINAGLILGRRGTLENGLIRENYAQVYIGITLNDKWFIDYKYR